MTINDETVADGVRRMKAIKKGDQIPKDLRLSHDEVLAALDRGDEVCLARASALYFH